MKFCLINNLYPPDVRGGAEIAVERLAQGLKKFGTVVVIATQEERGQSVSNQSGVKVYRLRPANFYSYLTAAQASSLKRFFWHLADLFNFATAKKVKEILVSEDADVVWTHNLKGFSYQIPRVINQLKIPHLHTLHDYQLLDPHGSLYRQGRNLKKLSWPFKIYQFICRQLFSKVDVAISPSQFVLDKHLSYGFFKNCSSLAMPNPVAWSNIKPGNRQASDKIRLLYLGQLEEHKGIKFFLETFSRYPNNNFSLAVVGTGSLSDYLKEHYQDARIKFYGQIAHEQLAEIFANIDLTVVPSLWWENSPTVIYESYAYQVPVLAADAGGIPELVQAGKIGYLFKAGDPRDLLAVLDKVAQNRANLAKLGLEGREFIKQYSLDNYLTRVLALCRSLKK